MSPERKESNATWQNTDQASWDEETAIPSTSATIQDENDTDVDELSEPFSSRFEFVRQIGQQISPILAPLLFGGLTFVFTLPLILSNRAYLHTDSLWPVGLVILALAVLQGMGLYYAGSNNLFWSLGIVGGFFLFLIVGCFTIFGPIPSLIMLGILLAASIIVIRLYIHPVTEGSVDIVYAFGKYNRTLYPGLNFLLPWEQPRGDGPLSTRETQWTCPEQKVHISRNEDVLLKATLSYQLVPEDAYIAALQVNNWEGSLQDLFIATVQTVANELSPDDFIEWPQGAHTSPHDVEEEDETRWDRINTILFQRMRDRVALWGVQINWVSVRDVSLIPHFATNIDTGSMASTRPGNMGNARGATPIATPPLQASTISKKSSPPATGNGENLQPAPAGTPTKQPQPAPAPATLAATMPGSATASKIPKEEVLIKAYKEVHSGNITDPETIRSIAERFEIIANDAEASKTVSFDAARAARNLYDRAKIYEEQATMRASYEDDTQADWVLRRPTDDNLTAGG